MATKAQRPFKIMYWSHCEKYVYVCVDDRERVRCLVRHDDDNPEAPGFITVKGVEYQIC